MWMLLHYLFTNEHLMQKHTEIIKALIHLRQLQLMWNVLALTKITNYSDMTIHQPNLPNFLV